jgi:hypothetical protein
MSHLETNDFNMMKSSQPSMLGLGFRWDWSICHYLRTIPNTDKNPIYTIYRDKYTNSLIGMIRNFWASIALTELAFYFVSMLGAQWMDTLARLNFMTINPGGWAVPKQ